MKILVTGGFGFIGHTLVQALMQTNQHEIHVVDCAHTYNSFSEEFTKALYSERLEQLSLFQQASGLPPHIDFASVWGMGGYKYVPSVFIPDAGFTQLSFSDVRSVEFDDDYDVIYHLAGYPRQAETKANTFDAADIHARGLMRVLHGQKNLQRIVYFSTSMAYGDFDDWVDERRQPNPESLYGFMRLIGERMLMQYCKDHKLHWNIIRPCTVYGERDTHNRILGRFMWRHEHHKPLIVRGKDVILDFTHVSDVVQGCMKLLDAIQEERVPNEIFNISHSKVKYTIDYLATLIDALPRDTDLTLEPGEGRVSEIEYEEPDAAFPKRSVMGIDKARTLLGYEPQVSLEEGVQRTWQWFQSSTAMRHADTNR